MTASPAPAVPGLDGKVALVTGGANGIGLATVRLLAASGARVVVADLDEGAATTAAEQVGGTAVRADVTSADDCAAMVATAVDTYGRLDVVACNAGLTTYPTPAVEIGEDDFDATFAVNVKGAWLTARAAIPALRAAGGGAIVVTGSVMGERTRPGFAAYAPSKAAANHLARSLAVEHAPDGIRVNAVAPVATDTAMLEKFLGTEDPAAARQRFESSIPLGRLATPDDVASAICFLASDSASFLTGVVLPVDGGRSI
jgi:3-oxoacyl-[acyl-carrier protein] reductase